jgi:cytochrome c biogenesis protein CcmG/thiol:disulfide interchange protein DsbE
MTTRPGIDATMTTMTAAPAGGVAARPGAARLPRSYYVGAAIAPLLIRAVWGALLLAGPTAPPLARIGDPAPAFVLADLDGNPVSLAHLRGRPVIVNFWASWCGPCVEEFPLLSAAAAAHEAEGLAVVGIVFRDRSEAARDFLARMGATWPSAMDPGEAVATRFGIISPPDSFFIDRQGVVVGRQIGQLSAADLERGLAQILGEE